MAANTVEIVITTSQQGKGFTQANRDMEKLEKKSGRLRGALGGVGRVAGGVMAAGLAQGLGSKAVGFFQDSTSAASDFEEALSKSNAVFGDQAAAIEGWSKNAAETMGISQQAALDAAGGFGNMFDQLGIGSGVAAEMTRDMTGLAADFASFNNLETEDVIAAQSAAFRGEYDSLQRVLPLINATTVQQKAMAQTGKTSAKELTQQEKAMATYALMLEGAGEAQGDFAKTSDGLANSQRIAEAKMADMRAEMGKKLMPVAQKITAIKLKLAEVLVDKVLPAFEDAVEVVRPLVRRFGEFFEALRGDGDETSTISKIGAALRRFKDFVVREVVPRVQAAARKLAEVWERIEPKVTKAVETIGEIVAAVMELVTTVIGRATETIMFIWERWGDELTRLFEIVWGVIGGVVQGALDIILGIIRTVIALIKGDWEGAWDGVKQILSGAWTAIEAILVGAMQAFLMALEAGWDAIKAAVSAAVGALWDAVKSAFGFGADEAVGEGESILGKIVEFIAGLGPKIARAALGIFDGIPDAFGGVIDTLKGMWNRVTFQKKQAGVEPVLSSGGRDFNRTFSSGGRSFRNATLSTTRRRAAGGPTSGLTLVGEQGAELVDFGAGGRVVSNPDTERNMARRAGGMLGGAGVTVNLTVQGSVLSERDLIALVRDELITGGLAETLARTS